jgi:type IV secretion system protein VirB10
MRKWLSAAILIGLIALGLNQCHAQTIAQPQTAQDSPATATAQPATRPPAASPATPAQPDSEPVGLANTEPAKKIYTVPTGTKVLLQLRSSINTRSARPGDGVYLSSTFPVVIGNRVLIPAGVYVQGVVDRVQRAGQIHGRAQLDMHFTSMIFPNGSVVDIPGVVSNVPGAKNQTVAADQEGTIQQDPNKGRNAGTVAEVSIPTGATIGTIGGIAAGHGVAGGLEGVGAGLAAMAIATLFTRGADVNLEAGTQVEMVLQRPLMLEEQNLSGVVEPGAAPVMVPAARQPKPITQHRPRIVCPPGGLGCE